MTLCQLDNGVLLIVDVQQRLLAAMSDQHAQRVVQNIKRLAQASVLLSVPVMVTEQYPQGLGPTNSDIIAALSPSQQRFSKTSFSCLGAEGFSQQLNTYQCDQVLLAGMETHVCILQTALELIEQGKNVYLVTDATCSRHDDDHNVALGRLQQAGVCLTTTEAVIFEWIRDAEHPCFKEISQLIKTVN